MYLIRVKKSDEFLIHIASDANSAICNARIAWPIWKTTDVADEDRVCSECKEKAAKKKKYAGWTQADYDKQSAALRDISNEMYKKEREAQRVIYRFTKE